MKRMPTTWKKLPLWLLGGAIGLAATLGAATTPNAVPTTTAPVQKPEQEQAKKADDKPAADANEDSNAVKDDGKAEKPTAAKETESSVDAEKSDSAQTTKPTFDAPHFELYIPSAKKLSESAQQSRTAKLVDAVASLFPKPDPELSVDEDDEDESIDPAALLNVAEKLLEWPDTSIRFTTYAQDRDGRPQWALATDWPVRDLVERVRSIIQDENTGKLFENLDIVAAEDDDGVYRLELPDLTLAYLAATDHGSVIKATQALKFDPNVFGVEKSTKGNSKETLVFSRLNLDVDDDTQSNTLLTGLVGFDTIDYELRMYKDGRWRETYMVQWNALVGVAVKALFGETKHKFNCPAEAYVNAVVNLGNVSQTAADGLAGLQIGTIGSRAGSDMGITVLPGKGFLPFPDTFFQFRLRNKEGTIKAIRKYIEEDTKTRTKQERRRAWYEDEIDGDVVFWRDPTADYQRSGILPVTYRNVIFFEDLPDADKNDEAANEDIGSDDSDEETEAQKSTPALMIVSNSSTWHDMAVANWRAQSKQFVTLPSSKSVDWQGLISWKRLYQLAHPYMVLAVGASGDQPGPPSPEALDKALADSRVDIKIGVSGFYARHVGPVPVGMAYNPAVAAVTLGSTAAASSELAREQIACERLRTLQYHCKLFAKDYDRWPATVAELDGYVDFASHPELLRIRPKKTGFLKGFVSVFSQKAEDEAKPEEDDIWEEEEAIDDSLYVIDWSADPNDWRLRFRDGEFKNYKTIAIDTEGEIERVPLETNDDGEAELAAADGELK